MEPPANPARFSPLPLTISGAVPADDWVARVIGELGTVGQGCSVSRGDTLRVHFMPSGTFMVFRETRVRDAKRGQRKSNAQRLELEDRSGSLPRITLPMTAGARLVDAAIDAVALLVDDGVLGPRIDFQFDDGLGSGTDRGLSADLREGWILVGADGPALLLRCAGGCAPPPVPLRAALAQRREGALVRAWSAGAVDQRLFLVSGVDDHAVLDAEGRQVVSLPTEELDTALRGLALLAGHRLDRVAADAAAPLWLRPRAGGPWFALSDPAPTGPVWLDGVPGGFDPAVLGRALGLPRGSSLASAGTDTFWLAALGEDACDAGHVAVADLSRLQANGAIDAIGVTVPLCARPADLFRLAAAVESRQGTLRSIAPALVFHDAAGTQFVACAERALTVLSRSQEDGRLSEALTALCAGQGPIRDGARVLVAADGPQMFLLSGSRRYRLEGADIRDIGGFAIDLDSAVPFETVSSLAHLIPDGIDVETLRIDDQTVAAFAAEQGWLSRGAASARVECARVSTLDSGVWAAMAAHLVEAMSEWSAHEGVFFGPRHFLMQRDARVIEGELDRGTGALPDPRLRDRLAAVMRGLPDGPVRVGFASDVRASYRRDDHALTIAVGPDECTRVIIGSSVGLVDPAATPCDALRLEPVAGVALVRADLPRDALTPCARGMDDAVHCLGAVAVLVVGDQTPSGFAADPGWSRVFQAAMSGDARAVRLLDALMTPGAAIRKIGFGDALPFLLEAADRIVLSDPHADGAVLVVDHDRLVAAPWANWWAVLEAFVDSGSDPFWFAGLAERNPESGLRALARPPASR